MAGNVCEIEVVEECLCDGNTPRADTKDRDDLAQMIAEIEALSPEAVDEELEHLGVDPTQTIAAVQRLIEEWRKRRSHHLRAQGIALVILFNVVIAQRMQMLQVARPWRVGRAAWYLKEPTENCRIAA